MDHFTIAAISTPTGTGGIGVVRLSGEEALAISEQMFKSNSGKLLRDAKGYTGMLGRIFDEEGDLDEAIALVYRAPASYTGEDVVELSCHGGAWILQRVLRLCLRHGACPAAPGEFTKRAFLNGKMALSQAEAVIDLIGAQGDAALRAALCARDGRLTGEINKLVEDLLSQSAHLAAWADYPDEDLEELDQDVLYKVISDALTQTERLLATWDRGHILREGVRTVIAGRPNVGKSTLMNLLSGGLRSIVTDVPGTTRDVVEDCVRLGDCVLHIADTAGIRETQDPVECIGVAFARDRVETADLVLAVFDSSESLTDDDLQLLELLRDKPCIAVVNKIDLPVCLDVKYVQERIPRLVMLSALEETGREELEYSIKRLLKLDRFDPTAAMVWTERQRECLRRAQDSLLAARGLLDTGMTLDAVNVSLDCALDELLSLTGRRASAAVVDEVFARFCVGK